ncbi:MAG: hypothetical protein ACPL6F_01840, partial [Anaerolineales bacterium]
MTRISAVLLDDTFKLIQLARETARVQGNTTKAEQLKPLVEELKTLTTSAREGSPNVASPQTNGIVQQSDFKTLLNTIQKSTSTPSNPYTKSNSIGSDRNKIVLAMVQGGMGALDVARQMGMTLEEVNNIVSIQAKFNNARKENNYD